MQDKSDFVQDDSSLLITRPINTFKHQKKQTFKVETKSIKIISGSCFMTARDPLVAPAFQQPHPYQTASSPAVYL